ncbi:MAG: ferritin family protein [Phycisphaerae bacterium]|nr:ferritin family protein [Phycisphaerae bacterium]
MSVYFNADEVLEMAEQIERNGARFYRRAAETQEEAESKKMLLNLALIEDEHEKTFAAMRARLAEGDKTSTAYDPDDEGILYLQAMADGYIFDVKTDPSTRLTGAETMTDILRTAIGLEKDSVIFYLGLKRMVPEWLGKGNLDGIIAEEMGHITLLSNRLKASTH